VVCYLFVAVGLADACRASEMAVTGADLSSWEAGIRLRILAVGLVLLTATVCFLLVVLLTRRKRPASIMRSVARRAGPQKGGRLLLASCWVYLGLLAFLAVLRPLGLGLLEANRVSASTGPPRVTLARIVTKLTSASPQAPTAHHRLPGRRGF